MPALGIIIDQAIVVALFRICEASSHQLPGPFGGIFGLSHFSSHLGNLYGITRICNDAFCHNQYGHIEFEDIDANMLEFGTFDLRRKGFGGRVTERQNSNGDCKQRSTEVPTCTFLALINIIGKTSVLEIVANTVSNTSKESQNMEKSISRTSNLASVNIKAVN